jgi:hypothetical protein
VFSFSTGKELKLKFAAFLREGIKCHSLEVSNINHAMSSMTNI